MTPLFACLEIALIAFGAAALWRLLSHPEAGSKQRRLYGMVLVAVFVAFGLGSVDSSYRGHLRDDRLTQMEQRDDQRDQRTGHIEERLDRLERSVGAPR